MEIILSTVCPFRMDPFFQSSCFGSLNFCSFLSCFSWEASMKFSLCCAHEGDLNEMISKVPTPFHDPVLGIKSIVQQATILFVPHIQNINHSGGLCTIKIPFLIFWGMSIEYFVIYLMSCWIGVHGKGLHLSFLSPFSPGFVAGFATWVQIRGTWECSQNSRLSWCQQENVEFVGSDTNTVQQAQGYSPCQVYVRKIAKRTRDMTEELIANW